MAEPVVVTLDVRDMVPRERHPAILPSNQETSCAW